MSDCVTAKLFGPILTLKPTILLIFTSTPEIYPIERNKLFNNMLSGYEYLTFRIEKQEDHPAEW